MMDAPWWRQFHPEKLCAARSLEFPAFLAFANQSAKAQGLVNGFGKPLVFIAQDRAYGATDYESSIASTGQVPTRDCLHDRYNALIWLTCPLAKAALNRYQVDRIKVESTATGSSRGRLRDALTLWDENLAVVSVPPADLTDCQALFMHHDWHRLFNAHRDRWGAHWKVWLFGHALLEKLEQPYKAITAHTFVACLTMPSWTALDRWLYTRLDQLMGPEDFLHLPLMGLPGWHLENDAPSFYQDTAVFRPAPRRVKPLA